MGASYKELRALVLAGGEGHEMRPLSEGFPKTLLRILGKPLVCYSIEGILSIGVNDIAVVTDKPSEFIKIFSRMEYADKLRIINQKGKEIEGAILSASNLFSVDEQFLLAYGDIIVPERAFSLLLDTYASRASDAVIMITPQKEISTYGVPRLSEGDKIEGVVEKPSKIKGIEYAVAGIYLLPGEIFELIEKGGSFSEALNLLARKYKVIGALWSGWWIDVGYPWDVIRAARYLLEEIKVSRISNKSTISPTAVIEGPVIIEEGAHIDHYSTVKGPAYIGRSAYVGTYTLIRNHTDIEEGCIIGSYSEVNHSVLQPKVTVGRGSFVGYSVIGSNSVIEPETITTTVYGNKIIDEKLDIRALMLGKLGSAIGNNVKIGLKTIIKAGSKIPSNSIVPPGSKINL